MPEKNILENVSAIDLIYGTNESSENENNEDNKDNGKEVINTENKSEDSNEENKENTNNEEQPDDENNEEEKDNQDNGNSEDENTNEEENNDFFSEINKELGLDIEENFDDSKEGLLNYIKTAANKIADSKLEDDLSAFPDVKEYLEYRKNGGDPNKYKEVVSKEIDYEKFDLDKANTDQKIQAISDLMKLQGFDDKTINDIVKEYVDKDLVDTMASKASHLLKEKYKKDKDLLLEQQRIEKEKQEEEAKKAWNEIGETIKKGTLKNVSIPEIEKKQFLEWMYKPIDKEGNTQRNISRSNMDMETALLIEYLAFKNLDFNKINLINNNDKRKQSSDSLSKRFNKKQSNNKISNNSNNKRESKLQLPDFEQLI